MDKTKVVRLVLQVLAGIGGLFGLFSLYFAFSLMIRSFSKDTLIMLPLSLISVVIGIYLIYMSYLMIRKYSPLALKHFSATIAVFLCGWLIILSRAIYGDDIYRDVTFKGAVIIFGPFVIMILLYKISEALLVRLAGFKKKS